MWFVTVFILVHKTTRSGKSGPRKNLFHAIINLSSYLGIIIGNVCLFGLGSEEPAHHPGKNIQNHSIEKKKGGGILVAPYRSAELAIRYPPSDVGFTELTSNQLARSTG